MDPLEDSLGDPLVFPKRTDPIVVTSESLRDSLEVPKTLERPKRNEPRILTPESMTEFLKVPKTLEKPEGSKRMDPMVLTPESLRDYLEVKKTLKTPYQMLERSKRLKTDPLPIPQKIDPDLMALEPLEDSSVVSKIPEKPERPETDPLAIQKEIKALEPLKKPLVVPKTNWESLKREYLEAKKKQGKPERPERPKEHYRQRKPRICSAPNCRNRPARYHAPRNMKEIWKEILMMKKITPGSQFCAAHFEPDALIERKLRKGTLPLRPLVKTVSLIWLIFRAKYLRENYI